MSERIELMRAAFEAFSRGDDEAILGRLAPEFVIWDAMVVEDTTEVRGPDALRQNLARVAEAFERVEYEPREFLEAGERVLIRVGVRVRGASSELGLETEVGQIWTLRGEEAIRLEVHPSWEEARRAIGLGDR